MRLTRLLILPALAALLVLAVPPAPATAAGPPAPTACPCWDAGGPFYTPAAWCRQVAGTEYAYTYGHLAMAVDLGFRSYCRNNAQVLWTTPDEHESCIHSLALTCAEIFAVAYIDRNNDDRFNRGDGLIAKLVDANGDGIANGGDVLVADEYPLVAGADAPTGRFRNKTKHCSLVDENDVRISCEPAGEGFLWSKGDEVDQFADFSGSFGATPIFLLDVPGTGEDVAEVTAASELDPDPPTSSDAPSTDDDNFIDVYVRP